MTMDKTTKMRDQTVVRKQSATFLSDTRWGWFHTNDWEITHGSVRIKLLSQVGDQQQRQEDGDTQVRQAFGRVIVDEVELGSQNTDPDSYQDGYGSLDGPQEGDQDI